MWVKVPSYGAPWGEGISPARCWVFGLRSKEAYFQALDPKACFKAKAELRGCAAVWPRVTSLCWIKMFENSQLCGNVGTEHLVVETNALFAGAELPELSLWVTHCCSWELCTWIRGKDKPLRFESWSSSKIQEWHTSRALRDRNSNWMA